MVETVHSKGQKTEQQTVIQVSYPVLGMSCAACAQTVENQLQKQSGVHAAPVNYAAHTVNIEFATEEIAPAQLQAALQDIGYDLLIEGGEDEAEIRRQEDFERLKRKTWAAGAFAIPLLIIGMFFMNMPYAAWITAVLATPILFVFGRQFFINAWKQAGNRKANMDTLVALSTGIAYAFSLFNLLWPEVWLGQGLVPHVYFEASGVIIFFILIGKFLEEKAGMQTSSALKKLIGMQAKTVNRINPEGIEEEVSISRVREGDVLFIRPGERIPVDGRMLMGSSWVDESSISGEPLPVEKKAGSPLYAGTINQKGIFRFEAQKVGRETVLGQIIEQVRQAQGSKAPVQKLADRIAGIFVPIVMGISLLTLGLWLIIGGLPALSFGLMAMVTVLVIACPCALGLATPTAIMVGVGKAAENGILIKDAQSLELGKKVDTVILDKTGTLTKGEPELQELVFASDYEAEAEYFKRVLLSLERRSEHPLALAVVQGLAGVEEMALQDFHSLTGMGVEGKISGVQYFLGNRRLMDEQKVEVSPDLLEASKKLAAEAVTQIWLAADGRAIGLLGVSDQLKDTSVKAVAVLQNMGIEVIMLTGDNEATAAAIAKQCGISEFRAEMLPGDKAEYLEKLQAKGKVVAMVGDGINDSQALAKADVSIAMGKGSDIAMDVAKMTLISSDLLKVPEALKLARKTLRTIRQNLFWAFFYNVVGIPLAAGILFPFTGFLLNPMIAGAAMALSSVSVLGNSLRLKFS